MKDKSLKALLHRAIAFTSFLFFSSFIENGEVGTPNDGLTGLYCFDGLGVVVKRVSCSENVCYRNIDFVESDKIRKSCK